VPTYDYRCDDCGHEFDVFQRMSEDSLTDCPHCERPNLRRLIGSGAGIIFKGSGFYETDYKRSKTDTGKSESSKKESSSDSKESKPKESASSGGT
jgi:putative FmdB family regulatory protein